MKVAVFSDTRLPTKADGGHGLGMSAHSIATGLAERGYEVTLCAGLGSEFEDGHLETFEHESEMANWCINKNLVDVVLDTSHLHILSMWQPAAPAVNRIADMECRYQPPNAVVNSDYMREQYPKAKVVKTGIVDPGHFRDDHDGYLLFVKRFDSQKMLDLAKGVAKGLSIPLKMVSGLSGFEKWQVFSGAACHLNLTTIQAAPRLPIELAYCGVPTACLSGDGTEHVVYDGLTGFTAHDESELSDAVAFAMQLDRKDTHKHVKEFHSYDAMIDDYEHLLLRVKDGSRF